MGEQKHLSLSEALLWTVFFFAFCLHFSVPLLSLSEHLKFGGFCCLFFETCSWLLHNNCKAQRTWSGRKVLTASLASPPRFMEHIWASATPEQKTLGNWRPFQITLPAPQFFEHQSIGGVHTAWIMPCSVPMQKTVVGTEIDSCTSVTWFFVLLSAQLLAKSGAANRWALLQNLPDFTPSDGTPTFNQLHSRCTYDPILFKIKSWQRCGIWRLFLLATLTAIHLELTSKAQRVTKLTTRVFADYNKHPFCSHYNSLHFGFLIQLLDWFCAGNI